MPSPHFTILGGCRWVLRRPPLLLLLLGLLFFSDLLLHPTQVLYSDTSDLLALHLPDKRFLVRSWQQTGELPLWCPYRFAGVPFLHDIQTSMFYPLHWPLLLLPEAAIGPALSWLVVLHTLLAGWGMYAYARFRRLDKVPALVAAIGYMFAGKWLLHVLAGGHYNLLMLAWLPLCLLLLELANRRLTPFTRLLTVGGAGIVFSFFVLAAYPYLTLYAGLFLALWSLGAALDQAGYLNGSGPRSRRRTLGALGRWVGRGVAAAVVGVGLGAVQLLPALELTRHATRGAGHLPSDVLKEGALTSLSLVGPTVTASPPNLAWELRGGFGLLWLGLAVLAPVLVRGRVRFEAGVAALFFVLALGGAGLLTSLPGFTLFRLPSRILLVAAYPVAYFAGVATQALLFAPGPSPELRARCRRLFVMTSVVILVFVGLFACLARLRGTLHLEIYWLTLAVSIPLLLWLLGGRPDRSLLVRTTIWVALLLIDLWAIALPHVAVRPEKEVYTASPSVRFLAEHCEPPCRVLDHSAVPTGLNSPLGTGAPLALIYRLESLRGFNPMDVQRYKEYLEFITDDDEPLRPLVHPLTGPVMADFPVRNRTLLELLGTRYLLQPRGANPGGPWRLVAEDPHPRAFDALAGGMQSLPAYTVYEDPEALPRAFVVGEAAPLPERDQVLKTLKNAPFRQRVLLEGLEPGVKRTPSPDSFRPAEVVAYHANQVRLHVPDGPAGYLVLTDVYFPGWHCTIDGQAVPVYRANYLFRAAAVTAGAHDVVFTFEPESYGWGKVISLGTLGVLGGLLLLLGIRSRIRPRNLRASAPVTEPTQHPRLPPDLLPTPVSPAPP